MVSLKPDQCVVHRRNSGKIYLKYTQHLVTSQEVPESTKLPSMLVEVSVENKTGVGCPLGVEARDPRMDEGGGWEVGIKCQTQGWKQEDIIAGEEEFFLSLWGPGRRQAWPFPQSLYGRSQEVWTWGERQLALCWGWPGAGMCETTTPSHLKSWKQST